MSQHSPTTVLTDEQLDRARPRAMTREHLRAWMVWQGLAQTEVAAACHVDRRTVYRWTRGMSRIPRAVWPRLAQAFGEPLPLYIEPQNLPGGYY